MTIVLTIKYIKNNIHFYSEYILGDIQLYTIRVYKSNSP